ncbi:uncharacterized protein N7469_010087 [Penicillium citrinum]|uniref:Zn(2)-C6 fungal-type domain-containing protein n=1 Tax=Penicillium citrinum TaxID=5077 RepID=A0A9W9NJM2_PENCI|nr:uncharacterized protein N7469_010087 [Penicillium citrinum]KAJ5221200.1 hypothetical protein N7469_010087 [Penicillium citrinum]
MSPDPDRPKKAPRKHVTTACVPCRESKIRCDGSTPHCQNCERKGKDCKYQHGDDKRKVSLRAATELFSARIDQLCQFIQDQGLIPPPMDPDDEAGMNRVLDTLQIPRGITKSKEHSAGEQKSSDEITPPLYSGPSPTHNSPTHTVPPIQPQPGIEKESSSISPSNSIVTNQQIGVSPSVEPWNPYGMVRGAPDNQNFVHWGVHPAQRGKLGHDLRQPQCPDTFQLGMDMVQQPGVLLGQVPNPQDHDSDSDEENPAESDVIEQLSNRIGTLKIAGDGHLRFYGATSNLNLVDVSATQQRQRPDARTVRHDGQDILNHLRVGQPVDQALEDHLVELFFTWQNPSIYVVDKAMYMTARTKWRNEYDDTPFYSEVLTNAMCAIGSAFEARYHPTFITFPKSLAEFFADRAKALLEIELDTPCVATVQALVLLSCHEGASNRDARGWLYSGMSMRLAFDLGLHLDMSTYVTNGDMSAHEADVRRTAFWGSYVADHFWGFYLGRPFRMAAGDITVPKPASTIGADKDAYWHPYGLQKTPAPLGEGLKDSTELICRQFVVLWEMISPVGHILYGCSDISRHDLQRITFQVTEDLFAWKRNLPSILEIDLDDEATPRLPHLLILHMQYHQIIIFFHRPWVSKNYIQPRSPRQGPGYHHARRMCVESATAIARLLDIYEKHYSFRRMNNQAVAIIFSAALMLLFVTVSSSPLMPSKPGEISQPHPRNAEMVAYLNLCFRALDELGQSFENAKRTRDFLVTLQRRWQAHMRRSGPASKRQMSSANLPSLASQQPISSHNPGRQDQPSYSLHKKSRLSNNADMPQMRQGSMSAPSTANPSKSFQTAHQPPPQQNQQSSYDLQQQSFPVPSSDNLNWMNEPGLNAINAMTAPQFTNDPGMLPDLGDLEGWWSPGGNSSGLGGPNL